VHLALSYERTHVDSEASAIGPPSCAAAVVTSTRARGEAIGVTQEELIETITHLASYARWPNAITAITGAKEVFEKR